MKRLGTYNGYNYYNNATNATWYAIRRFQASHHLKVTDNVDQKTWAKLGLGKKLFKQIDSYTAPLGAQAWEGRKAHIEAMIRQAYKYMGHPYLVGSSSMTRYGTDCCGLVIQRLYAGGISPVPVSAIGHAHPGNEWNSRNLWADKKLKRASYAGRRRGDLAFYYQPGARTSRTLHKTVDNPSRIARITKIINRIIHRTTIPKTINRITHKTISRITRTMTKTPSPSRFLTAGRPNLANVTTTASKRS